MKFLRKCHFRYSFRRSPCGERGLKCKDDGRWYLVGVAPRAGSVD